jgi:hypothetical protein
LNFKPKEVSVLSVAVLLIQLDFERRCWAENETLKKDCDLVVEHLPTMCQALSSIPSTTKVGRRGRTWYPLNFGDKWCTQTPELSRNYWLRALARAMFECM